MTDLEIIADLIRVGTGEIEHDYNGDCPSPGAGPDWRDHDCQACIAVTRGEGLLIRMAAATSSAAAASSAPEPSADCPFNPLSLSKDAR